MDGAQPAEPPGQAWLLLSLASQFLNLFSSGLAVRFLLIPHQTLPNSTPLISVVFPSPPAVCHLNINAARKKLGMHQYFCFVRQQRGDESLDKQRLPAANLLSWGRSLCCSHYPFTDSPCGSQRGQDTVDGRARALTQATCSLNCCISCLCSNKCL